MEAPTVVSLLPLRRARTVQGGQQCGRSCPEYYSWSGVPQSGSPAPSQV